MTFGLQGQMPLTLFQSLVERCRKALTQIDLCPDIYSARHEFEFASSGEAASLIATMRGTLRMATWSTGAGTSWKTDVGISSEVLATVVKMLQL